MQQIVSSRIVTTPRRLLYPIAIFGAVLLLVPFGRSLQAALSYATGQYPLLLYPPLAFLTLSVLAFAVISLQQQFKTSSRSGFSLRLLAIFLLAAFVFQHIHGMLVELTHVIIYSGFYIALRRCLPARPWTWSILTFCSGLLLAAVDESLQYLDPDRVGDFRDITLNCVSLLLGILLTEPRQPAPDAARGTAP